MSINLKSVATLSVAVTLSAIVSGCAGSAGSALDTAGSADQQSEQDLTQGGLSGAEMKLPPLSQLASIMDCEQVRVRAGLDELPTPPPGIVKDLPQQLCYLAREPVDDGTGVLSGGILFAPADFDPNVLSDTALLNEQKRGLFIGFDSDPAPDVDEPGLKAQRNDRGNIRYMNAAKPDVPMAVWAEERPNMRTAVRITVVAPELNNQDNLAQVVSSWARPAGTKVRLP